MLFAIAICYQIVCASSMDIDGRTSGVNCDTITPESVAQPGPTGNSGQPER